MCSRRRRPAIAAPSSRIPVPASRTNSEPSAAVTCTQEVFPPNRSVAGAGHRHRAADAPEPGPHQLVPPASSPATQKKTIAP